MILEALFLSLTAAADVPPRSITVTGKCIRAVVPDRGAVTATADFVDLDLQAASKKAMAGYETLKSAVQKLSLKGLELTTSESSIQEEREWQKDKSVFKGFRARMGLTVSSTEVSRLGEVIALAAKNGIRQVSGLSMFLSPEKEKVEREACLDEAVKNAQSKASTIAKSSAAKLGRILWVTEGAPPGQNQPGPVFSRYAEAKAADAAPAPAIEAAPERISVDVTATFSIVD